MKTWSDFIAEQSQQPYLKDTLEYVAQKRSEGVTVFPPEQQVFSAFDATPFEQVKVVILGQDPYHGPDQAHGLCFSVLPGIKPPPSLANMYKELVQDIEGFNIPDHGYLMSWAEQGVLLLNTVLTVEQGQAHSHKHLGWEKFTDKVIDEINQHREGVVFLLWGAHAQKKGKNIDKNRHHILHAPHPSPLSAHRGFFGCQHFSKTNEILDSMSKTPINWQV
ncbi:uracil-DNA glycosylase [Pseudoalteromonas phenolica]|uniref:Uracil-DNA glycosylase n=1 Tax=Pseudoalteromonas phenolica TaxID=161398 RepID=A0A0S2K540_9GAMM|nr:uracil-DNA glycosylase [Pseudoalteromonas phenolica]MAD90565.1 uracil-DNA glycosylase [Pseudoalteromonas sp.]ALO43198.1 Uracil-DNA glycosylase [Pseudoalteromonas phenolica]MBE0355649.1 uracil-DNA glycosylase [Pseudoalteromonas phenolica O-BC30]RXF03976.1 uracil-DNA glycosylase [Pseudoalteromonas phenolica O-BC30]TMO56199.1 uracil-DNA glycosylase [Pseudoalteromonas phenolica]